MDSSRRPIYGSPEHQKGVFMRNIIDSRALFPSKGATKTHTHANQTDRQIKSIKHKREAKARQRKLESLVAEKNAEIRQLNKASKQSRETRYKTSPPYHPGMKSDFYQTNEWRKLRWQAISSGNGKCQVCGRTQKNGIILHVDHKLPRSKYPELELDICNLQLLCEDCNMGKGAAIQTF